MFWCDTEHLKWGGTNLCYELLRGLNWPSMRDKLQSEELQSAHRHARPVSLQLSSSLRASHWYTLPYVCMYMCVYLYACTCHSLPAIKPSNHRIHFYVRHLLITTTHTHTTLPLVYSYYSIPYIPFLYIT